MTTYKKYMDAVKASDLSPTQRHILEAYAYHANWKTGQNVRPSQETVARETGYSVRTVEEHTPKLVQAGWLTLVSSGRGGNSRKASEYTLSIPIQTAASSVCNEVQTADDRSVKPQMTVIQTAPDAEQQVLELPIEPTNTVDGTSGEQNFSGEDEACLDNRAWLSGLLGVSATSIGPSLWLWLDAWYTLDDADTIARAAKASLGKENPAGYFKSVLPRYKALDKRAA